MRLNFLSSTILGDMLYRLFVKSCQDNTNGAGTVTQTTSAGRWVQSADLWGWTRSDAFNWCVAAVTLALVVFEGKYNIDLLGSLSDPLATGSQADALSQRGKLLASFGISWAVGRWLLTAIRPALLGAAALALLSWGTYLGLDHIYTTVIANLKPEVKVMGFNLYSYRHDLLTGDLEDPDIPLPEHEPILGKIFMGAFPMVLVDERFMLPAQDIVKRKAEDKGRNLIAKADNSWAEYDAQMQRLGAAHQDFLETSRMATGLANVDRQWQPYAADMDALRRGHAEFIDNSRRASGRVFPEREWTQYRGKMQELDAAYSRFIDGSRRAAPHGARGANKFRQQSGGLDPNPNLRREDFPALLRRANLPEAERFRQSESAVVLEMADGKRIVGRDVPNFMTQSAFQDWHAQRAREAMQAMGLTPQPDANLNQFVELLRKSENPRGKALRAAEQKVVGRRADGKPILGRDVPYFMDKAKFVHWMGEAARQALAARQWKPDPKLPRDGFLSLLRVDSGSQGEQLRQAEARELGRTPDGKVVRARDIPYFMNYQQYSDWVKARALEVRDAAMPTTANVEHFAGIRALNASVFLPPMAIISSLMSALTNGISLVLLLLAVGFERWPPAAHIGRKVRVFGVPLMLGVLMTVLLAMPNHVFRKGTAIYDLETTLHQQIGLTAKMWSKLSNLEKFIL